MVRLEDIPTLPEKTLEPFRIRYARGRQEEAIRQFAAVKGYPTLRGFWRVMKMEDWDYYKVLNLVSPRE